LRETEALKGINAASNKLLKYTMKNKSYTATIELPTLRKMFSITSKMFQNGGAKILKAAAQNSMMNLSFAIPAAIIQNSNWLKLFPGKQVVWLVTDSKLNWLETDKYEWTNTKMVFEITTKGDKTVLHFTHERACARETEWLCNV
jgi:hypothetical protein